MKIQHIITGAIVMLFSLSVNAQLWHVHINNTDISTQQKLAAIIAASSVSSVQSGLMTNDLRQTEKEMNKLFHQYYDANAFDKKHESDYIKRAAITAVHGIMSSAATRIPKMPYMTENKKEYLDKLNASGIAPILVLKEMSIGADEVAKADNRQEIYRLRSEVMALLSNDDKEVRKKLLLPFGAYSYENRNTILNFIRQLNQSEIIR